MRFIFLFPDIGEGISEGRIVEWYVREGQNVKSGENLVKMETDKVVADIPSPKDGTVTAVFGKPGEIVGVHKPLVELETADEGSAGRPAPEKVEEKGVGVVGSLEVAGDAVLPASGEGVSGAESAPSRKRALATPVARAMARELGVDIDAIPGTGPDGRVTKEDIRKFHEGLSIPAPPIRREEEGVTSEPLSQIRKAIAKRMVLSKHEAAHMTVFEEVEISALLELHRSQKDKLAERGVKLTLLPFVAKAAAMALKKHPALNSELDMAAGRILYKHDRNIGIAVDAPEGLVVPVVRNADFLTIAGLARAIADLSQKARERRLKIEEMRGGTFSITNYGAIAGLHAVPIINYPEVAILGVGRFREQPVVRNRSIEIGTVLPLSLSVDHRAVDGGEATRFLKDVMDGLSDPVSLLLGE